MHYTQSDDGKVIDGKVVVWISPPGAAGTDPAGPASGKGGQAAAGNEEEAAAGTAGHRGAAKGHKSAAAAGSPRVAKPLTSKQKHARKMATAAASAKALGAAAQSGIPFCEECEAARRRQQEKKS